MIAFTPNLSQLNPNFTPDLSQLYSNLTPDLSQLNPNSTPDLSQLNPNFTPDLSQLNPNFTPDPGVNRLPSHVLRRLHSSLNDLLVERDNQCFSLYHRQLREVVERKYNSKKVFCHKLLAIYFTDIDSPEGIRQERRIQSQPIVYENRVVWYDDAVVNRRRCIEGIYHCVEAKMYDVAAAELCNLESICAHVKAGEGFNLVLYISEIFDVYAAREVSVSPDVSNLFTFENALVHLFAYIAGGCLKPFDAKVANFYAEGVVTVPQIYHYMRWMRQGKLLLIYI
jgi:hypothetical protein